MHDSTRWERRYRRLLRAYPRAYHTRHGTGMVTWLRPSPVADRPWPEPAQRQGAMRTVIGRRTEPR